jgi:hypothetical protein
MTQALEDAKDYRHFYGLWKLILPEAYRFKFRVLLSQDTIDESWVSATAEIGGMG